MTILALDTSATAAAAVVADDGTTVVTRSSGESRRHAELLTPLIEAVMADAGVTRADLTAVVAGTGPAPFTGLRVGLVTARTLGLALDIPVHGVSSLDALALAAATHPEVDLRREVLVVADARRKEVYWARYRVVTIADTAPTVELAHGPGVEAPAVLAAQWGADLANLTVVGQGTALYPRSFPGTVADLTDVDPAALARVALARISTGQQAVPLPTEPLYLRRPDAVPPAPGKRVRV